MRQEQAEAAYQDDLAAIEYPSDAALASTARAQQQPPSQEELDEANQRYLMYL